MGRSEWIIQVSILVKDIRVEHFWLAAMTLMVHCLLTVDGHVETLSPLTNVAPTPTDWRSSRTDAMTSLHCPACAWCFWDGPEKSGLAWTGTCRR